MDTKELIKLIEQQKAIMISTATNGPRIETVNHDYIYRRDLIATELAERKIDNPNPHLDLWDWHGKWSSGDLPTWRSRREYIANIYNPIIVHLKYSTEKEFTSTFKEPTGWIQVDRTMSKMRNNLALSKDEEDFQGVGLLCREIMISLAQIVYDPQKHLPTNETKPSATDAKRMLDFYISYEFGGSSNEVARRHAKAALDLANDLQHRRTARFRDAALCAEATGSIVNIIAIMSGKRDPE